MATIKFLLAGSFARGWWNSTLDWWFKFSYSTRTPKWLCRHVAARLTVTNMAEIRAIMNSTAKFLATLNHAKMFSFWVRTMPYRTANFLAAMSLTLFNHVAHSLALQVVNLVYFLCSHKLSTELIGIVDLVTRELCLLFVTDAAFVYHLFASHAFTIMTLHLALVPSTR